jgi:hypothetical protein
VWGGLLVADGLGDEANDLVEVALAKNSVVEAPCQHQQNRMLSRQQARGLRRTHRTMLGANACAQMDHVTRLARRALGSCNALVGQPFSAA